MSPAVSFDTEPNSGLVALILGEYKIHQDEVQKLVIEVKYAKIRYFRQNMLIEPAPAEWIDKFYAKVTTLRCSQALNATTALLGSRRLIRAI